MGVWVPPASSSAGKGAPTSWAVLGRVVYAPQQAFAELARHPRWALALVVLVLASTAVQLVVLRHLDVEATVREQITASPRGRQLSEEQLARAVEQGVRFAPAGAVVGLVSTPVLYLVVAGIYFLGLQAVGAQVAFRPVFSATLHAMVPPGVVGGAVTAFVVARRGAVTGGEVARAVKSNVAAFLAPQVPAPLRAAAEVLDIFNAWMWVLLAVGLAEVGRVPRARAAAVVAVVWLGWVGLRVLLATLVG